MMDAVDWTALSVLVTLFVAIVLGAIGYLARQMNTRFDRVDNRFDRVEDRFERLEERYVRHLELHAGHG
jgi:hypothetical protein